jgi:hypothetical protein
LAFLVHPGAPGLSLDLFLWSIFGLSHPQSRATPVFPLASWKSTQVADGLGYNVERHVAGERAAGRGHGDIASGCAWGNCSADVCVGNHGEARRDSAEENAGCSRESLAENGPGLPDLACGASEGDERAEAQV